MKTDTALKQLLRAAGVESLFELNQKPIKITVKKGSEIEHHYTVIQKIGTLYSSGKLQTIEFILSNFKILNKEGVTCITYSEKDSSWIVVTKSVENNNPVYSERNFTCELSFQ